MKKETLLKQIIIDILELKSLEDISKIAQLGMAILLIAYHQEKVGIPFPIPTLNDYLDNNGFEYTDKEISKVMEIIKKNKLLKDGKINSIGSENIDSGVTWALWSNLFEGDIKRMIKNREAFYKITDQGIKRAKGIIKKIDN